MNHSIGIQRSRQLALIYHLFKLNWTNWPVDLGLHPDHLTTSAENARIGALMALAGGDSWRAKRFLKQGGIEDQFDKVAIEFSALIAEHADLMESLPNASEPRGRAPGPDDRLPSPASGRR